MPATARRVPFPLVLRVQQVQELPYLSVLQNSHLQEDNLDNQNFGSISSFRKLESDSSLIFICVKNNRKELKMLKVLFFVIKKALQNMYLQA